jgi:hypothetical protein
MGANFSDERLKAGDSEPIVEDSERCLPVGCYRANERPARAVREGVEGHPLPGRRAAIGVVEICADRDSSRKIRRRSLIAGLFASNASRSASTSSLSAAGERRPPFFG